MTAPKLLVVGWDGATWQALEPLLQAGHLPTLAALRARSAWAILQSTEPPVTAPAWCSFMTGMVPSRHGLLSWQMPLGLDGNRRWVSARDLAAPTIWRRLSDAGLRVCVINFPLTYPPEPLNGLLIGGMLTPGAQAQLTYPPELREELLAAVPHYQPDVEMQETERNLRTPAGMAEFLREVRTGIAQREAAVEVAQRHGPFDALFVMFEALDRLQHPLWQYVAGTPAAGSPDDGWAQRRQAVTRCLNELDAALGRLLARCDERTTVLVVSDHGFGPLRAILHINTWLAGHGWLHYTQGKAALRATLRRAVAPLRRYLPAALRRRVRQTFAPMKLVDWPRTVAYAGLPTEDGIWLNVRGRDPWGTVEPGSAYEALRTAIIRALAELRHPTTGEPLVIAACRREEKHPSPYADRAPDIVMQLAPGVKMTPAPDDRHTIADVARAGRGHHASHGIFLAAGPSVHPGPLAESITLPDLAPTILALFGLPVPAEMDGRVLCPPFAMAAAPSPTTEPLSARASARHDSGHRYTAEEETLIAERLRRLGYLE